MRIFIVLTLAISHALVALAAFYIGQQSAHDEYVMRVLKVGSSSEGHIIWTSRSDYKWGQYFSGAFRPDGDGRCRWEMVRQ